MRKALLLLVVLAGFLTACENKYKDPDPAVMGYDYYPLEVGDYRVYDVTDIRFQFNNGDTSRFQIRERVDTSFYDQTGQLVFKMVRSIRENTNRPWIDDSVMTVAKTERMVVLTKDNTKYVKLVFPVKNGTQWVGDAFNSRIVTDSLSRFYNSKEQYVYARKGEPYNKNGLDHPKTITVVQGNSSTVINFDDRYEVYAEGVGLVYRLFNRSVYCRDSESIECPYNAEYKLQGHERHEILIEHGKL